jgi:hypothetical protein
MEMSDEELKFATEAEKAKAIQEFDESKGSESDLESIMNAKIEPVSEKTEAADIPPQSPEPKKEDAVAEEKTEPEKKPATVTPSPENDPEAWAKSKGFDSFAAAKKAWDEKEDLVQRQTRFIKEKIESRTTPADQYSALVNRTQQLEAELSALKGGATTETKQEKIEKQENKIAILKQSLSTNLQKRKSLADELRADPTIAVDGEFLTRRLDVEAEADNLNLQLADEMNNLQTMFDSTSKQMKDVTTQQQLAIQQDQNRRLYDQEMDEIDGFASNPKYSEFAFSDGKDSRSVEADYVKWANAVASAVFASPVNMLNNQQEKAAVAHALDLVKNNDPEAVNACRVAGVSFEPDQNVRKYLDICDLLNHRDGKKLNPMTGQMEQQYRMVRDPVTNQFRKDPVRLLSLEDAYQHRCAIDGTYQQRIKDAYVKGSKAMAAAAQKRAAAPVELDNATGASAADAGLALSPADAMKVLETIDETEAMRKAMAGDRTLLDKYEKALSVLETVSI